MENLNKKQSETLQRALKFYSYHFDGFQIHWFKMKFKEDKMLFYCSDSFGMLFELIVDFDQYVPIFVVGTQNGKEIYFGNNRLELGQYLHG